MIVKGESRKGIKVRVTVRHTDSERDESAHNLDANAEPSEAHRGN